MRLAAGLRPDPLGELYSATPAPSRYKGEGRGRKGLGMGKGKGGRDGQGKEGMERGAEWGDKLGIGEGRLNLDMGTCRQCGSWPQTHEGDPVCASTLINTVFSCIINTVCTMLSCLH